MENDDIVETPPEETPEPEIAVEDSILNSVKKLLGLLPESKEFDTDITIFINAAIFTLQQIGIGPQDILFTVTDETQTYVDYLGEEGNLIPLVKTYLFQKTKLGFDPPQSSVVEATIKEMIKETEWRLNVEVETIKETVEEEVPDDPPPIEEGGDEECTDKNSTTTESSGNDGVLEDTNLTQREADEKESS